MVAVTATVHQVVTQEQVQVEELPAQVGMARRGGPHVRLDLVITKSVAAAQKQVALITKMVFLVNLGVALVHLEKQPPWAERGKTAVHHFMVLVAVALAEQMDLPVARAEQPTHTLVVAAALVEQAVPMRQQEVPLLPEHHVQARANPETEAAGAAAVGTDNLAVSVVPAGYRAAEAAEAVGPVTTARPVEPVAAARSSS